MRVEYSRYTKAQRQKLLGMFKEWQEGQYAWSLLSCVNAVWGEDCGSGGGKGKQTVGKTDHGCPLLERKQVLL